jgi:hypothetical protein
VRHAGSDLAALDELPAVRPACVGPVVPVDVGGSIVGVDDEVVVFLRYLSVSVHIAS